MQYIPQFCRKGREKERQIYKKRNNVYQLHSKYTTIDRVRETSTQKSIIIQGEPKVTPWLSLKINA